MTQAHRLVGAIEKDPHNHRPARQVRCSAWSAILFCLEEYLFF